MYTSSVELNLPSDGAPAKAALLSIALPLSHSLSDNVSGQHIRGGHLHCLHPFLNKHCYLLRRFHKGWSLGNLVPFHLIKAHDQSHCSILDTGELAIAIPSRRWRALYQHHLSHSHPGTRRCKQLRDPNYCSCMWSRESCEYMCTSHIWCLQQLEYPDVSSSHPIEGWSCSRG